MSTRCIPWGIEPKQHLHHRIFPPLNHDLDLKNISLLFENIFLYHGEYFCVGRWREEKCDWGIQAQPCLPPQWAPPSPSLTSPPSPSPGSPFSFWPIIAYIVCFLGFNGFHGPFHEMICVQNMPHLQIFGMPRLVNFSPCAIFDVPDKGRSNSQTWMNFPKNSKRPLSPQNISLLCWEIVSVSLRIFFCVHFLGICAASEFS